MRILVAGGAGFLGSHLCEHLLGQGHEVLCVDNFRTGSKLNVLSLLENPNFELLRHDVTFPLFVEVDAIYNLACPASPVHYQRDPVQTIKTSVNGTTNLLGIAKRLGIPFLQASTSEIYGDPEIHPQHEDYVGAVSTTGPRACYDEGKRCAETLCSDYRRQYGLDIKIARVFNTYGPNMLPNDGRVVSNFIIQALQGKPTTIYGEGQQTRSFCYVDDLIDGLILLMQSTEYRPVNLGNPNEITVIQLAKEIAKAAGTEPRFEFKPLPQDDPARRRPSIVRAMASLGWKPTTTLVDGLARTVEYFSQCHA